CGGCHSQPAIGGSSPAVNPQVKFAKDTGNSVPSFLSANGPIREARFIRNANGSADGGVHSLFAIPGCTQENFSAAVANRNVIFRIPTPVFGAGLIEQIPDSTILANINANGSQKRVLGIGGRVNRVRVGTITGQPNVNGNDGTVSRFGWKAQNQSLLLFSGEAYNVEMGISNELFPSERNQTVCKSATPTPNDVANPGGATPLDALNAIEKFAFFMRLLAPPTPSKNTPGGPESIANGRGLFNSTGCALCHTPTLKTGTSTVPVLSGKDATLYSDLLVHNMGTGLADGISQGQAGPQDFRTAPLWGLGKRIFFLHDGRTSDLLVAIQQHQSSGSEANAVIQQFTNLSTTQKQDLLNFLRSL
ncbi:MAG: di-heme oxidoredictase family protein, partial [Burkholderiales bacterium]